MLNMTTREYAALLVAEDQEREDRAAREAAAITRDMDAKRDKPVPAGITLLDY